MSHEITALAITAASLGLFHTVLGPDHYLPFIVMARARGWSTTKTAWITILCGIGHVGSSILLGLIGVGLGIAVSHLSTVESVRGSLAAWALMAFGLVYFVWGLRRAARNRRHTHWHEHGDGTHHAHQHAHAEAHAHAHEGQGSMSLTPWILFSIFVFGPCEPLIPLVMYPAARHSFWGDGNRGRYLQPDDYPDNGGDRGGVNLGGESRSRKTARTLPSRASGGDVAALRGGHRVRGAVGSTLRGGLC